MDCSLIQWNGIQESRSGSLSFINCHGLSFNMQRTFWTYDNDIYIEDYEEFLIK